MSMLVALAIIFSYIEFLIPINLGIPGMKLGLANLVIVIALYILKISDVWIISILRILIMGFMFGSGMSIIYSLAGAVVSLIVMSVIKKIGGFSIIGVSMAGAVCHNMGQVMVAFSGRYNYRGSNRHSFKEGFISYKKINKFFN